MRIAVTREVSPSIVRCELTLLPREPIDLERARAQHRRYEECLAELGCCVVRVPLEPTLPDAVFVEDTAIVLDEAAIVLRLGAESRRPEIESIAAELRKHRTLARIEPPGTVDGGDILRLGRVLYGGVSRRTNADGLEQLRALALPCGYRVAVVAVDACLHLKSAVTAVGARTLLLNPQWVDAGAFDDVEVVEVDPSEPRAANALLIDDTVIHAAEFPETRRRLVSCGIAVRNVEASELAKAEGGLTCCSLVFEA